MALIKPLRTTVLSSIFINAILICTLSLGTACSDDADPGINQAPQQGGAELQNSAQQEEAKAGYKKTILYNGKLELNIPAEFAPMGAEGLAVKYPKARPDFAYASDYGKVTLVFDVKDKPTTGNDIPAIKAGIDKKLGRSESYQCNIRSINGQQFVVAEFISNVDGNKNNNVMFMTDFQGKLLLGTFNYPPGSAEVWDPKKEEILSSLKKM